MGYHPNLKHKVVVPATDHQRNCGLAESLLHLLHQAVTAARSGHPRPLQAQPNGFKDVKPSHLRLNGHPEPRNPAVLVPLEDWPERDPGICWRNEWIHIPNISIFLLKVQLISLADIRSHFSRFRAFARLLRTSFASCKQ